MDPFGAFSPLLVAVALGAGMISFISPCVLPLVPAYLGYITGLSADEMRGTAPDTRGVVLVHGLSFVLGLTAIFALLGASATLLGQVLLQNQPLLVRLGGVLVVVFGLHMLGLVRIPFLYQTARVAEVADHRGKGLFGAFMMGLAFGAGWTPCIGPFLAGILTLAATEETVTQGVVLLIAYALGLGVPFLAAGLAVDRMLGVMRAVRPHLRRVEQASGVLLVGMGILLFSERFTLVTIWLTRIFGNGLVV